MSGGGRCDWTWMVDAREDGRLADEQGVELTRHAAGCATCRRALDDAQRLRGLMAGLREPVVTDFDHRRERRRLMARAGRVMFAGSGVTAVRRWSAFALVALAILVSGGIAGRAILLHREVVTVALAPPRYEVTPLEDAALINAESGATAVVTLSRGSAAFHVHHLEAGQRFLVALPDGEIEVRGTRFVVDVEQGVTRYVVVMEGKVALRGSDKREQVLIAGQRWDRPVATAPAAPVAGPGAAHAAAATRPPHPSAAAVRTTAMTTAPIHHAPHPPLVSGAPEESKTAVRPATPAEPPRAAPDVATSEATTLFSRGVSALRAERYAEADAIWQEFLSKHPADARVEDAAFLRAVGHARSGDRSGAAALARAYLERFPQGMRRREAESLSRGAP